MKIRSIFGLALAVFACLKIVDLLDAWHFEWLFTQPWTEFIAPCIMFYVGIGMFDATICDIYLINDGGNLVGRPILTACIDGYSSLCCGYSLSWEGGVYSLRGLLLNIITNKTSILGNMTMRSSKKCCKRRKFAILA